MVNWIAWNRTGSDIEPVNLCLTELFDIELFWHLKCLAEKLYFYRDAVVTSSFHHGGEYYEFRLTLMTLCYTHRTVRTVLVQMSM